MRTFILIFTSSLIALLTDFYIYKRVISRHNFGRIWNVGYMIYAIAVDTMVVTALLIFKNATDAEKPGLLLAVMWVVGLFFLNLVPKIVYSFVSLGDYIVQMYTKRMSHIFGYTGTALGIIAAVMMIRGMTCGRTNIKVNTVELTFENLPASFDGFRIVQFSDLHLGSLVNKDKQVRMLADTIKSLNADIVVNTGDLINTHVREIDAKSYQLLKSMRGQYGTYSVLGNHDLGIYAFDTLKYPTAQNIEDLSNMQREGFGWHLLRNSSRYLSNGTDSIIISGIDYPEDFRLRSHSQVMTDADIPKTYTGFDRNYFNLTLSHAPQLWADILEAGWGDLTLAGHVHSMQVKFNLGKWSWSPARFFYKKWSGLYNEDGRYLYINDGIGYVMYPMRLGTLPEVTLIILRTNEKP